MITCPSDLSCSTLKDIILKKRVFVEYQPILSARNHLIVGVEGLIRGRADDESVIAPLSLFDAARRHGLTLELDRLCREKILESFRSLHHGQENILLFLNIETSFLSAEVVGSGYLLDQVRCHKIPPSNIVIEIVESKTPDTASLLLFVNAYRQCGFNIALDDVGTGHSNFDRMSLLKPDIIKVDRSIISGMATNYFKQEIFKSLSNLAKNIGCLTLAEGVETQEEVLCGIEYGADLLQGYFFSRPKPLNGRVQADDEQKLKDLLSVFKSKQIDRVKSKRLQNERYQEAVQEIVRSIQQKSIADVHALLKICIDQSDILDAVYIINSEGVQITQTIMKENRRRSINPVFRAANVNEDLSHKDYVYQLIHAGLPRYTTDRYISFATGNLCVTLSHWFEDENNRPCILCTDFLVSG